MEHDIFDHGGNGVLYVVDLVRLVAEKSRIDNGKQTVKDIHDLGFVGLVVDIHLVNRTPFFVIFEDIVKDSSNFLFNDIFHKRIHSFSFPFNCTRMIAENISTHPISSRLLSRSCKIRNPASREKTDSMLIRIEAAAGGRPRCAKNCKV